MPDFDNMVAWSFHPDKLVAFKPDTEHMMIRDKPLPVTWDAGWVEANYGDNRTDGAARPRCDRHYVVRATVQVDRFPVSALGATFAEARERLRVAAERAADLTAHRRPSDAGASVTVI